MFKGRGLGRDVSAQVFAGFTRALFGKNTNVNVNPTICYGGSVQTSDNGTIDGLFVAAGPYTTPGGLTFTETEPWSLVDTMYEWWVGANEYIQSQGDPFPPGW